MSCDLKGLKEGAVLPRVVKEDEIDDAGHNGAGKLGIIFPRGQGRGIIPRPVEQGPFGIVFLPVDLDFQVDLLVVDPHIDI